MLYMIAGCGPMSRARDTVRPVRTSACACARFASVIRFTVPRWSASPQRPQLFSSLKYASTRSCVGGVQSVMGDSPSFPRWYREAPRFTRGAAERRGDMGGHFGAPHFLLVHEPVGDLAARHEDRVAPRQQ